MLPNAWKTAWVQVEMEEDHGSAACFYVGEGTSKPTYVRTSNEIDDTFRELWKVAQSDSAEKPWTTATFTLHADGDFNIDYGYKPIPIEEMDSRRRAWKAKYLP